MIPEYKPWGLVIPLLRDERVEIVRACIQRGGYSSLHRHNRKNNVFIMLRGGLTVEVGRLQAELVVRQIEPGTPFEVAAGVWHRFRSYMDCEVLEVYTTADGSPPLPDDIERVDRNGISL